MIRTTWQKRPALAAAFTLLLSIGLSSTAHADELKGRLKQCKLGAKDGKKRCKAAQKAEMKACKALVKTHKVECKARKKACKAEHKALKKNQGKKAPRALIKCEVQYKVCKVEAKADVKRCEQTARRAGTTCLQKVEVEKNGCRAFMEIDTSEAKGQCRATCTADFRSSVPNCKADKKIKKSTCALEHKLRTKDCKVRKSLCGDENRVFKHLTKTGGELPAFASEMKPCRTRKKACEESAKEELKLCRRALNKETCEPPEMRPCIQSCVAEAEAKAKAAALAQEEDERRAAKLQAERDAKLRAKRELEERLMAMPSARGCRKHATKVYPELLKAIIDAIYPHKDNINKAFTTFEKVLRKRKSDNRCVLKSMKLWSRLAKPLNRLLQDHLPDAEAEFERRLGTSGLALINDTPFSSLLDYTFNKYKRYLRR
ncbi:MAG: hypothetical protein ACPGU1_21775 [Myxococcota bacterium]